MRKSSRVARRPTVEAMEGRALLSGASAQGFVLNPAISVTGEGPGRFTFTETPRMVQFVVLSQAGAHPFAPLTSLVPGTIKLDGLAAGMVYIRALPADANGDGIPDALVTVATNASLKFPAGQGYLIVTGTIRHSGAVWAAAAPIDVFCGTTLGGNPPGELTLYNGYINIVNDTGRAVYDSLLTNTPPGGNVAPYPGTYVPLTPNYKWQVYTGPGTPNQLGITANFSLSPYGTNPFYAQWYAGNMTLVKTFPPPQNVITWYLHYGMNGFYFNTAK